MDMITGHGIFTIISLESVTVLFSKRTRSRYQIGETCHFAGCDE
jgi:hypothetical protein